MASNIDKTEDTAHATGAVGALILAVRKDAAAALADTDGDYIPLTTDDLGRLHVAPNELKDATVFASAARTATENSDDQDNERHKGVLLVLDITATGGTPTLDVKVQAKDSVSGKYIDIPGAAFAQKSATGTDSLVIYPGVAETANRSVSDVIPRTWRVVATIGGTTPSFTFSVGASLLP